MKRVISIRKQPGTNMFYMKLLKKDIGELALQVLQFGNAAEQSVINSTSLSGVSNYVGPEINRDITRKRQNVQTKSSVAQILRTFRS